MPQVPIVNPQRVGISPDRLQRAYDLLQKGADTGEVPASVLCVGRRGAMAAPRGFGVPAETPFLVASIAKPVTASAVVRLVEEGRLGLDDRVVEFFPEFVGEHKEAARVRHLLTHTSGLPDMLPENDALRASHASLDTFIEATCRTPLLFRPGTKVRYQSMGFTLLGGIVERVSGHSLREFLQREFFEPLGMTDSAMGATDETLDRIAPSRLASGREPSDWDWNSSYWRKLGTPWGGLIASAADLGRFARMMLDEGTLGRARVLAPASVRAMTRNALEAFPALSEEDRRCRPWGLGWRLSWPGRSAHFGDLLGPHAYGHWGATGTLIWIDPEADAFCVLLTNTPGGDDGRHLARVSSCVAAALE